MQAVILAVPMHPGSAPALLKAASRAAALLGRAHIRVLAIRLPPIAAIQPGEELLTQTREAELRAHEATRLAAIRTAYDTWPQADVAEWCETESLPEAAIAHQGCRADLLLLDRPQAHDPWGQQALRAALFVTQRPVLVLPPDPPAGFGRRVAIAWHDDPRCTAAVLAALPILAAAEAVAVLVGNGLAALPPLFAEHGIAATLHSVSHDHAALGPALLAAAAAQGADLLVAGAFWHTPLREALLGGVSRDLLHQARIPLLLRH